MNKLKTIWGGIVKVTKTILMWLAVAVFITGLAWLIGSGSTSEEKTKTSIVIGDKGATCSQQVEALRIITKNLLLENEELRKKGKQ